MTELEVLPAGGALSTEPIDRLSGHVAGWLLATARNSRHTRAAYQADIAEWLGFCRAHGIDPYAATKAHTDAWIAVMANTPLERTGRPPSPATQARRVSTVASFYGWLVDMDVIAAVPLRQRGRPQAPRESSTVGLTLDEAAAIEARCVEHEHARTAAVVLTLRYTGLRVGELIGLDVDDVQPEEGHEAVFQVMGKGGRRRKVPAARPVVDALGRYLEWRAAQSGLPGLDALEGSAPLFVAAGGGRYTQRSIARMVQRVARAAGVGSWARLSPHGLRHALITNLLDEGVGLDVAQDIAGHSSPTTTRRYDRARGKLSRTGAGVNALAAAAARRREERQ